MRALSASTASCAPYTVVSFPFTRTRILETCPSLAKSHSDQLRADRLSLGKGAQQLLSLVREHLVRAAQQLLVDHLLQRRKSALGGETVFGDLGYLHWSHS